MKSIADYLTLPWAVRLFEQDDDGLYYVITVEELPGFSVVGDTREEVISEYPLALRCYLEGCINAGEEPPLPAAAGDLTPYS